MLVVARFAVQKRELEHPEEMQAHQNDEDAGDLRKHAEMLAQQLPGNRGAGPQRDKDRRKAQHETQRRKQGAPLLGNRSAVLVGQLIERAPVMKHR